MDLYVAPSLLRAIRSPEYFQLAPVLIRIDPSIPGMEVANQMAQLWKLQIGSFVPSMNMFGVTLPTYILDDVAAIDAVTEMHLDTPQFAFNAPMGLPPLPMPTGMMPAGAPPGLPPALAGVFQDPEIRLTEEGWIPTAESIKVTNIPKLWEAGFNGEGVDVAVLDTGCDNNNPQLNGVVFKKSAMKLFPTGDDDNGHGSWVITCIKGKAMRHPVNGLPMAGGAPGCNMTSWKVLGYGIGTGATSDIRAAIDGAIQDGAPVINMSLGSDGRDDEENDPMVRQINMYAREKPQVLIVVANGNSGPDPKTVGVPAVAEGAISVGSYGIIDSAMAYFSSRGPTLQAGRIKPDIAAPGGGRALSETRPKETLFSGTSIGSMLDGFTDKVTDGFATLAGTSMGCPHVAAILANWKQAKPDLTGDDVRTIFRQSSGRKQNNDYGFGLIDATWIFNY